MESTKLFLPLLSLFFIVSLFSGQGFADHHHHHHHHFKPSKFFVIGDSFVDTGNTVPSDLSYPGYPHGITFPGKPAGRYSDGLLLTDYMAKFVGLKSPIPYRLLGKVGVEGAKDGINFAYSGSGVVQTKYDVPTLTLQTDFLQHLIENSTFTKQDIDSSFALVALSGNDYSYYLSTNGSILGFIPLIRRIVNEVDVILRRIHRFGVQKIIVTALSPLECLPTVTQLNNFKQCNSTLAPLVLYHNLLLRRAVRKLNKQIHHSHPFSILNLDSAFLSVIQNKGIPQGNIKFGNPLEPCCYGISPGYYCGDEDEKGDKKYNLCDDPKSTFYWDESHPTQQGWIAILTTLLPTIKQHL